MVDLLDQSVVTRIISEIEKSSNVERKRDEWKAYEVAFGKIKEYVASGLKVRFPETWSTMEMGDHSLSRMITEKRAQAYKEEPLRRLINKDASDKQSELANEKLSDIYDKGMFNFAYKDFDFKENLHRYSLLWVARRDDNYQLLPLAPYEFDVIQNQDTGELEAVILTYPDTDITDLVPDKFSDGINDLIGDSKRDSGAETKVYAMWSKFDHVVVRATVQDSGKDLPRISVEYMDIPENPNMENPLREFGTMPFVYLPIEQGRVDYPIKNPLTEQAIESNILLSETLSSTVDQGFGQLVLKYPEGSEIKQIYTGRRVAIELPQSNNPSDAPADANFINANPDISGQIEAYKLYVSKIMNEHGIEMSQSSGGDAQAFSSGLDRAISQASIQNIIQSHQEFYSRVEDKTYKIVRAYELLKGNKELEAFEDLSIAYPKPKVMISDSETLANIEKRIDLGLLARKDALMMIDPNLSADEAQDKIDEIEQEKKDRAERFLGADTQKQNKLPVRPFQRAGEDQGQQEEN